MLIKIRLERVLAQADTIDIYGDFNRDTLLRTIREEGWGWRGGGGLVNRLSIDELLPDFYSNLSFWDSFIVFRLALCSVCVLIAWCLFCSM